MFEENSLYAYPLKFLMQTVQSFKRLRSWPLQMAVAEVNTAEFDAWNKRNADMKKTLTTWMSKIAKAHRFVHKSDRRHK